MEWFILWIVSIIATIIFAMRRGRSSFGWFLISALLIGPLALLLLAVLPPKNLTERDQLLFDAMPEEQQQRVLAAREERARLNHRRAWGKPITFRQENKNG